MHTQTKNQLDLFQDMEIKLKDDLNNHRDDFRHELGKHLNNELHELKKKLVQETNNTFLTRLEMYGRMKGLQYLLNTFYKTIKI